MSIALFVLLSTHLGYPPPSLCEVHSRVRGCPYNLGEDKISVKCVRRWLKKLGYACTEAKKATYVDRHEQLDVVTYCKEFLEMKANEW